jgi:Trypsin
VVLTAGHCVAPGVAFPGIPAWPRFIRPVVSFSHDNPRDMSTWIDVEVMYIHPSFPCREAPLTYCSGFPNQPCPVDASGQQVPSLEPWFDVGVMVLARPVAGIKVAKIAQPGFLGKNVAQGARMTMVGYGETVAPPDAERHFELWDGLRRFGSSTMRDPYNAEWARFNLDPSGTCWGDSGGPTFFLNRIVAVMSDGGLSCDDHDHRAHVNAPVVLDWIESLIASLGPSSPPVH